MSFFGKVFIFGSGFMLGSASHNNSYSAMKDIIDIQDNSINILKMIKIDYSSHEINIKKIK